MEEGRTMRMSGERASGREGGEEKKVLHGKKREGARNERKDEEVRAFYGRKREVERGRRKKHNV
jgi:hypothetical protein